MFAVNMRYNCKSRYSYSKLTRTMERPGNKKRGPFLRSLFVLYSTMRTLCAPRRVGPERDALYNLTKEQRSLLSGCGLVQQRRESIVRKAERCQQRFQSWSQNQSLLIHMDNFNRLRFLANPATGRDKSINACAFAAIRLPGPLPLFHGYPSLLELQDRIAPLADAMSRACNNLIRDASNIANQGYKWSEFDPHKLPLRLPPCPLGPWQVQQNKRQQTFIKNLGLFCMWVGLAWNFPQASTCFSQKGWLQEPHKIFYFMVGCCLFSLVGLFPNFHGSNGILEVLVIRLLHFPQLLLAVSDCSAILPSLPYFHGIHGCPHPCFY